MGNSYFKESADYRYNPFTGTFTANPIGKSGNPAEVQDIPSGSPYYVYLKELPREDSPSTIGITNHDTGAPFTQVGVATPPSAGEYRVIYGGDGVTPTGQIGQGIVEFHSSDAGTRVDIEYYGLGSIYQREFIEKALHDGQSALMKFKGNQIISGGEVTPQTVPDMTVQIADGTAIVNGYHVEFNGANTSALTIPTNSRRDLFCVDDDGDLQYVQGTDSADPEFGVVPSNYAPIAMISLSSGTVSLSSANIQPINHQGCVAIHKNEADIGWFFEPQDAIDFLPTVGGREGGVIYINEGVYLAELDLSGLDNISIFIDRNADIRRVSATKYCIKIDGVASADDIRIEGGRLNGNGKSGAIELMKINNATRVNLNNIIFGSNSVSTATYVEAFFSNVSNLIGDGIHSKDRANIRFDHTTCTDCYFKTDRGGSTGRGSQIYETLGVQNSIHASNVSRDTIFDALDSYIPNNGDEMVLNGSYVDEVFINSLGVFVVSKASRIDSTTIRIYGTIFGANTTSGVPQINLQTVDMVDGSAVQYDHVSIAW
jgi:hypothetical protein